jgi:threonine dehydratase
MNAEASRLPTMEDLLAARARIAGHVVRTPILRHPLLDEIAGGRILLKAEPLQRTGSFKLRGATSAIRALPEPDRARGVVTFSSGNHGQAVACAAAAVGARATVFMPLDAPAIKVASTRAWGAEIIQYDRATDDREALAASHRARTGAVLIPPFDALEVIAGQGSAALELAEDAGETLDALMVCTGGGGFVAGCALAMEAVSPATQVIAVEPEGWDDTLRSLAAGVRRAAPGGSLLCDALLAPRPGAMTFAINHRLLAGAVAVTDAEVMAAIAFAFRHLKIVVEPGGAVCLAALLAGKFNAGGRTVGAMLSGGNIDPATFQQALQAGEGTHGH